MKIDVMRAQASDFEAFLDQYQLALVISEEPSGAWCARVPKAEYLKGLFDQHWAEMKSPCCSTPHDCVRMLVVSLNFGDRQLRKRGRFGLWKYFRYPRLTVSAETLAKVEREVGR